MKSFFKKYSIGFFPIAAACLLILVACISCIVSNGVVGYPIANFGWMITLSVLAVAAVCGSLLLARRFGNKTLTYLGIWFAIIAVGICFTIIVTARAELVGTLWITALDSVNPLAVAAMNSGATGFFVYLAAMVFLVIGGFMPIAKVFDAL